MANFEFPGKLGGPQSILAAAQDLTVNWVDLGDEIVCAGAFNIGLWVELDINGSTNARVRALAKWEEDSALEYVIPTLTTTANVVRVEASSYEFNVDADQNMPLTWKLDGLIPVIQFQVQAGAVGAPAGQIDSAYVTTGVPA